MNLITWLKPEDGVLEYPLSPRHTVTLGRDPENTILLDASYVSGKHGYFHYYDGKACYTNVSETNGTYLNGDKMKGRKTCYLESGDILRIGSSDPREQIVLLYHENTQPDLWNSFAIDSEKTRIGSASNNDLRFFGMPEYAISINYRQEYYTLTNHTSIPIRQNGKIISNSTMILRDNDVIELFGKQILFSSQALYYRQKQQGIGMDCQHVTKIVDHNKKILNDVSCTISPNSFCAIVGGSGAGKTTLMNAISGFEPEFEGTITWGGLDVKKDFKKLKSMIGYVPQQDILYENLALWDMLKYSAKLRMPVSSTSEQREQRMKRVLQMVDLEKHAKTLIRRMSGGQKKRASIAIELLADPEIFFLDEPTSGLDSGTERSLMQTLNRIAKNENKTIIMVTHTTNNLNLCDQILFMAPGGNLAFCGNAMQAKNYFKTQTLADIYDKLGQNPQDWGEAWRRRKKRLVLPGNSITQSAENVPGILKQFFILLARSFKLLANDKKQLLLILLQPLAIGWLLSMTASDALFHEFELTKTTMFTLSCAGIWIGLFDTIQDICKERHILKREYMASLSLISYMGSKVLLWAIVGILQTAILCGSYFMLIPEMPDAIWRISMIVYLTVIASQAMGLLISSIVKSGEKAMLFAPMLLMVELIFSGFLFKWESSIGDYISKLTLSKWATEALGKLTDLNSLTLRIAKQYPDFPFERETEEIFEMSQKAFLSDIGCIALIGGCSLILCLFFLRQVSKDRR